MRRQHKMAGACQVPYEHADVMIAEIIKELR